MRFPEYSGADPLDAFIGRTLKIWINSFQKPGAKERAQLLRAAAAMETKSNGFHAFCLVVIASIRWLIDNLFIGSADQPMIYSFSAEQAFSKNNNLTLLMANRGALDSYPIQLGVACLIN